MKAEMRSPRSLFALLSVALIAGCGEDGRRAPMQPEPEEPDVDEGRADAARPPTAGSSPRDAAGVTSGGDVAASEAGSASAPSRRDAGPGDVSAGPTPDAGGDVSAGGGRDTGRDGAAGGVDAGPPASGAPAFTRPETVCTLPVGGAEGPAWSARDSLVIVGSLESNTLYTCNPVTKEVRAFRMQTNGTSANLFDLQGHLLSIEQGIPAGATRAGARLMRTTAPGHAGDLEVVYDRFPGTPDMMPPAGRFNRPNDLVVTSKGTIYFTDPYYSNFSNTDLEDWEGIYRVSADRKAIAHAARLSSIPNGIALSPDERFLYVNARGPNRVMRFAIEADGSLGPAMKLIDLPGSPDGMGTGHRRQHLRVQREQRRAPRLQLIRPAARAARQLHQPDVRRRRHEVALPGRREHGAADTVVGGGAALSAA
jgi:sugar lactone lactonase YvrE